METTKKAPIEKPTPRPGFPLFPHASGRWAKKIRGAFKYFGYWREDRDGAKAIEKWLKEKDYLLAGRTPPPDGENVVTVRIVVNAFLTTKQEKLERGGIKQRTFRDYHATCARVCDCFGRDTAAAFVGPSDFKKLADTMKTWAPITRRNEITRVLTVFNHAVKNKAIPEMPSVGADFEKPDQTEVTKYKATKPERLFSAAEVRAILGKASPMLRAMILLGVNCGLGNSDVSGLNVEHLDLSAGILDYPRPKTGVQRRGALWQETVKALRDVLKVRNSMHTVGKAKGMPRHRPTDPADTNAVFLTLQQERFVKQGPAFNVDSLAQAFTKLLETAGIDRDGASFYCLRHSFRTAAHSARDQQAEDVAMGHKDPHIRGTYAHWPKDAEHDARLKAVADAVHQWLWPKAKGKEKPRKAA